MSKSDIRDIKIPDIDWDAVERGVLSREEARDIANKSVEFLITYRMLSGTGFLKKGTKEEAEKVENNLEKLEKEYDGFHGLVRKTFADKGKEMAKKDGDSKTLFNRLQVLAAEALCYHVIDEWTEERLQNTNVPSGLTRDFMFRIRDPRSGEYTYYLPRNWRNRIHKSVALVLKDLERKARNMWMTEKGIEPRKREAPAKDEKPKDEKETKIKTKIETKTKIKIKTKTKTRTKTKAPKKDEADVKAAKRAKKVRVEDESKEAEKEIREAKKTKDFAKLDEILPNKK